MRIEAIPLSELTSTAALNLIYPDETNTLVFENGRLDIAKSKSFGLAVRESANIETVVLVQSMCEGTPTVTQVPDILMDNLQNDALAPEHWTNIVNFIKHI